MEWQRLVRHRAVPADDRFGPGDQPVGRRVFGEPYVPGAGLGTWHYDGTHWTRIPSGRRLYGASALSPHSIWAFGGTTVAHWTGDGWARTSVAANLPPRTPLCYPHLTGMYAKSARSLWAVGTGGCQDQGGPFVLLHYNGTGWSRLALISRLGGSAGIIGDGHGGLWIPVSTGFPGNGSMLHYLHGSLIHVKRPIRTDRLLLLDAAACPRGTRAFAVGFIRSPAGHVAAEAVILRYG